MNGFSQPKKVGIPVILFRWASTLNLVFIGFSKDHPEDTPPDADRAGPESDPNLQLQRG